jgi:hypothetical protein
MNPCLPVRYTNSRHASSDAQFRMLPANFVGVDLSKDAKGRTSLNVGADILITSGFIMGMV